MKFRDPDDLPSSGGKNFVKLKDGEHIHGIFMGDIYEFFNVWENGKGKAVPEGTPNASFRFRINFVVKEGAAYVPKVFEQGVTVYKQLAELNDVYPLEKTLMRITRKGSSISDTTYTVMPMPQPVTPETLAVLKTLELNDLTGKKKSGGSTVPWPEEEQQFGNNAEPPPYTGPDEIPF